MPSCPKVIASLTKFLSKPQTVFFLILALLVSGRPAVGQDLRQALQRHITRSDSVIVAGPDGRILVGINPDKPVIPASTLKVLTVLAAIHYLGENYRYPTDFFTDSQSNLMIKGYGDPLMISEEIKKIAAALKTRIQKINDIVIDDTYFKLPSPISGTIGNSLQPYDAPNGAMCVNFNTVNFKKTKDAIVSAEPQTPLVPMAETAIKSMTRAGASGRILLTHDHGDITRYAGEIFSAFLAAEGIEISGTIYSRAVNEDRDRLIYRHWSSYDLNEIVIRLLEYSNNFIANQLLLTMGARAGGPPATLDKGVAAVKKYAGEHLNMKDLSYVEGSGISRDNRITAGMFLEILKAFRPYHTLMSRKGNEYFKTGTLNGISTRVGYLEDSGKNLYMFGIFINTPGRTAAPVIEDIRNWEGLFQSP